MREQGHSPAWQDSPGPPGPTYRPNEAFQRVLAAKQHLDRKIWGPGGGMGPPRGMR